jgi:hydroxymethylpyrimidine pyrophosphatase-like HAD family hydrolase
MGNAPDDVKAVADDVCLPVDEDGVAILLAEYTGQPS